MSEQSEESKVQSTEEASNWIPTSFSGTSETGEADSVSSFQSSSTPGFTAVDQQSDDQSFDIISRQKLSLTSIGGSSSHDRTSPRVTSGINMFEEDTRSSWSVEPKQTQFKETALDEDSQNSVNSQKSALKRRCSDDEDSRRTFPPENLFEYMWPQENGEFFILQEQICDYLNVKSFKRKYPDLARRTVDMDEKQFLKERGVVTEMQCDLGLTALRSEEVLELMSKDYPDHYKEYIRVLREKEQQTISEKHKEYAASNADKSKMGDLVKKAVQSAAEYNAHLNQERREERRSCMDLQTFTIHYPVKTTKVKTYTKPGKYPVSLLPGQFQDYYKAYSSDELKYLPVNTVLYGPLKEMSTLKAPSDGSHSDSDDSTASEGSCCSSSQGTHDDSSSGSEKNEKSENSRKSTVSLEKCPLSSDSAYRQKVKPNAICKVCKMGPEGKVKDGKPEELVHCSDCENSAHPSCIELTSEVVDVLKTYPWQCMDCKVCSHCRDPNDEDKMLFCDVCDRGYHTFCVGLKSLPQGKWVCRRCGSCSVCGASKPGPETSKAQWQYDITKGSVELDVNRRPKIYCQSCFRKKR
ncbi:PHD finger protein 10-like [Stegodyphus dumicola]|uniref:PHD finger protein 10-like n=1 Tax=Stegodyphus dumicola TaxID=202533 RepID=UPI0015AC4C94|nr:PHD finger protein 10-like [Stegodyphus dumicola]